MTVKFTSVPTKTLSESITSSATSFKLNSITGWDGVALDATDFGTVGYGVFRNAAKTQIELFEFDPSTIADASITITRRGLQFDGDLTTEVSGNKKSWTQGDTFVDLGTDTPQFFQYLKEYIDAASIAGAVPASTSAAGIVKEATQAQADAGTGDDGTYQYIVPPDKMRAKNYNDYVLDTGSADAYAIAPSPAITAYTTGQIFTFEAANTNTGTSTLNVNSLGTKIIKRGDGSIMLAGNILAGQMVTVVYDGTDFIVISELNPAAPQVVTFTTTSTFIGDSTTQFDITNTGGDTYRYTWDSTGTDPSISSSNPNVGDGVYIAAQNFNSANNGTFIVTGSGTNYFEVTNASGVAESNKTIGTGEISIVAAANLWTKDDGLKYIVVEVVGAGGSGASGDTNNAGGGGGGGGYARKVIAASSLNASEVVSVPTTTHRSVFGNHLYATSGAAASSRTGGAGGGGVSGDINTEGSDGGSSLDPETGAEIVGGVGGSSVLGGGGKPGYASGTNGQNGNVYGGGAGGGGCDEGTGGSSGGTGAQGIVIVTEYYA